MKKVMLMAAVWVGLMATALQTQAQSTSSEGNAANPAQSRNGKMQQPEIEPGRARAKEGREVSGSRPDSNSLSDKFGRSGKQADREARSPSNSDGAVSTKMKAKADPKTKKKRSNGRTFGNTGSEN
ncbi:hypothetical protein [Larkinella rosea]|uniref:Uncharacterized protein n=1 Tax=Larkinella rosea TaxID=2025312 RepID=A0A3P1BIC4_9BACT|nr:hypothetical protein [Larkinella rosea]RRB00821.1 hypothetical protein EHT25_21750 [Larkinella rosea]